MVRPRLLLLAAVAANVVHPFVHGTPIDGGALDALILATNGAAMCCETVAQ